MLEYSRVYPWTPLLIDTSIYIVECRYYWFVGFLINTVWEAVTYFNPLLCHHAIKNEFDCTREGRAKAKAIAYCTQEKASSHYKCIIKAQHSLLLIFKCNLVTSVHLTWEILILSLQLKGNSKRVSASLSKMQLGRCLEMQTIQWFTLLRAFNGQWKCPLRDADRITFQ